MTTTVESVDSVDSVDSVGFVGLGQIGAPMASHFLDWPGGLVVFQTGNVAFHGDIYGRKADDYRIPGYPYLFDQTRPVNGRQPNSSLRKWSSGSR